MANFNIEVVAERETLVERTYGYGGTETKRVAVTEEELYEAVSKYLQVKGFQTAVVAVTDSSNPVLNKESKEN